MIQLKGIAWDHPRGYEPLRAASKEFKTKHPNVSINWDIRSLKEFGDMPIEDLIEKYDLITIDHPYMGQAHANKLLVDVSKHLSSKELNDCSTQTVGPSFNSYKYKGKLFALPIDAAALVAAYRKDLLAKNKVKNLPLKREDLFTFYKQLPAHSVAWALCPTDFWCAFLTICAQNAGRDFIADFTVDDKVGAAALDEIKQHLDHIHPESINWNPIQILDQMAGDDKLIYAPYLFGYTNYSRANYAKNIVHFINSPINPENLVSTILGGVGLSVSAKTKHISETIEFVKYVASAEVQTAIYTKDAGQPGNIIAWNDEANNIMCGDFFSNTLKTMENAYVRPQHPGWNSFQEAGAWLLHEGVVANVASTTLVKQLNDLYQTVKNGKDI